MLEIFLSAAPMNLMLQLTIGLVIKRMDSHQVCNLRIDRQVNIN